MSDSLRPRGLQTLGFPALHHLPEFTQTRVLWVSDAIQPSHPLSPPSPPVLNLSQHQGLFRWVDSVSDGQRLELQYCISGIRRTEYCSQASSVHVINFSTCTHTHVRTRTHTHTHTHAPTYLPLSPYQAPCPWAFARLFPPPDTLIQPSIFLPLIKCYSFLRAHCKCCFLQDVFPDPSQGGHIWATQAPSLDLPNGPSITGICVKNCHWPPPGTPTREGSMAHPS